MTMTAEPSRVAARRDRPPDEAAITAVLTERAVAAVFQPIVSLADGAIVAYEALARVTPSAAAPEGTAADHPGRTRPDVAPDEWLHAADACGLRDELELLFLAAAFAHGLPPGGARLFVNVSAPVLADPRAAAVVPEHLAHRVVFELTETEVIADYEAVRLAMRDWSSLGAHLAIDDTGSGYASLRHVLQLCPDVIKLDRSLISGIDHDRNRRALTAALVSFASELGAEVVAEGVEEPGELAVLLDARVGLAQGWLLARPAPPWATAANPAHVLDGDGDADRFLASLSRAADPTSACAVAVEHLAHRPGVMPSAYLLQGDRLRCQAQRGLWQVLDGMAPGAGITGTSYAEQREVVVEDVHTSTDYLEAIPGVRSEACVPIRVEGMVVGALNIDVRRSMTADDLDELRHAAERLGDRLSVVGRRPVMTAIDQLSIHMRRLLDATTPEAVSDALVRGALAVSGFDSAMACLHRGALPTISGPLRAPLEALARNGIDRLGRLVEGVTSCYTAGSTLGHGFVGMDMLRREGVRAIAVVPLRRDGRALGLLLVANTQPCALGTSEVEPLELLASAASLRL